MPINKNREDYRFYKIWADMKHRCSNPNCKSFMDYGGRGIQYSLEWHNYENFKNDMWLSYREHCNLHGEKQTTLDRIDVNGFYCRENCRWATYQEQRVNIRNKEEYYGYNLLTKQLYSFNNCMEFCKQFGFVRSAIIDCLKTNHKHHNCVFVKNKTNIQDAYKELLQKAQMQLGTIDG